MPFEIEEDHLRGKGFVAGESRAGILASAALHASKGVKGIFPGEVRCLDQAKSFRVLDVDESEFPARKVTAEENIQGSREHVEIFRVRHVGDEPEDHKDVEPPGGFELGVERRRVQTSHETSAQPLPQEGQTRRLRMQRNGGHLEIEVAQRNEDDKRIDQGRVLWSRGVSFGSDDEPADREEEDAGEDQDGEDVNEEGEEEAEGRLPEKIEAVEESFQRMVEGHGIERERAIEDEDMHKTGEEPLVLERASLQKDLGQGLPHLPPDLVETWVGASGPDDPVASDEGMEESGGGREDDEAENEFFPKASA